MSHSHKEISYSTPHVWREDNCAAAGDGRGGVGPRKTHLYPQNTILAETGMMGFFRNISVSTQYPLCSYLEVGIIQLVILMVLSLVLIMDMLKVLWVLGPPTLPPQKLIVLLMVIILCYQALENIHP